MVEIARKINLKKNGISAKWRGRHMGVSAGQTLALLVLLVNRELLSEETLPPLPIYGRPLVKH